MKLEASGGKGPGESREWTPLELAEVKTPRRIGSIWQAKGASSRRRVKFGTMVPDTRMNLTSSSLLSKTVPAYEDTGKRGETGADGS